MATLAQQALKICLLDLYKLSTKQGQNQSTIAPLLRTAVLIDEGMLLFCLEKQSRRRVNLRTQSS